MRKSKIERIKRKMIVSGNKIEYFTYEVGYLKGYSVAGDVNGGSGRTKDKSEKYEENRAQAMKRARTNLRRIINSNCNANSKFVTLTFEENLQDVGKANSKFTKFIKRLNYAVFDNKKAILKYSCVVEFQKRGAVHYHVVFYNLPYIKADRLKDIWGHGYIKINKIRHIDNLGAYVCKYMTEELGDQRLEQKKCYFNSRNLKQPMEITSEKQIDSVLESLSAKKIKPNYCADFENDYLGKIEFKQYYV